jgi:hypothetical protein
VRELQQAPAQRSAPTQQLKRLVWRRHAQVANQIKRDESATSNLPSDARIQPRYRDPEMQ